PRPTTIGFRTDSADPPIFVRRNPHLPPPEHRDRGLFFGGTHPHVLFLRQFCARHDVFHCLGALRLCAPSRRHETRGGLGALRRGGPSFSHAPQTLPARSGKSESALPHRGVYWRRHYSHRRLVRLSALSRAEREEGRFRFLMPCAATGHSAW